LSRDKHLEEFFTAISEQKLLILINGLRVQLKVSSEEKGDAIIGQPQ
jgi:hypothetical protein